MTFVDLICLILALVWIELAWFHSKLFATPRAYTQAWGGFFGDLFKCAICLSFWLALGLVSLSLVPRLIPLVMAVLLRPDSTMIMALSLPDILVDGALHVPAVAGGGVIVYWFLNKFGGFES